MPSKFGSGNSFTLPYRYGVRMKIQLGRLPKAMSFALLESAAMVSPALAQPADESKELEEVVVVGEAVARANNVVSAAAIETLSAAQNVVDAIRLVPGVQIRSGDAFNNDPWSYGINIRGYDVNQRTSKIGQTLDGVPLFNASYYLGGAPAQKFILSESVGRIQVNQGTADVGSPSSQALGGTIAYFSREPSAEAAGLARVTVGDFDARRYFGRYDFGTLFGNTRAYVATAQLDAPLWPHQGSTPAAIEQFAVEAKSVSEFGPLTLTLFGSYNDSDDDPIIETTRAFINATNFEKDGSTAVFNTQDAAANEYWADEWAAIRENTLVYARLAYEFSDSFKVDVTPYTQGNEGVGEFLPPGIRARFDTTGGAGGLRQVMFGGTEIRASRAIFDSTRNQSYGVLPYDGTTERVYTSLDGRTVRSSECFNADNTVRVNATGNNAGQPVCSSAQSYRNSLYYHVRSGVVANAEINLGAHTVRGGLWYENLDRDFGRAWRAYHDIRQGTAAFGPIYRQDFEQTFVTDLWKFWIADTWQVTDQLTLSAGIQHYLIDIEGTSAESGIEYRSRGELVGRRSLAVNSDSKEILPSVGVVYEVSPSLQVFAGYAKNFGAIGDWALERTGTDLSKLEPEFTQNYEAGVRFDGESLRAAATVYHNQYDSPIVFLTNEFAVGTPGINYNVGTGGTYFNIPGGLKTTGLEGSIEFDLSDRLRAYFAGSWTDGEYTREFRAASTSGGSGRLVPAGAKVAGTPETIFAAQLSYEDGPFKGTLSGRHVGEAPGNAANTAALTIPSYTVMDASAAYRIELAEVGGRFVEFSLAVSNLTNERYISSYRDEFNEFYMVAAPRTLSATVSFGF